MFNQRTGLRLGKGRKRTGRCSQRGGIKQFDFAFNLGKTRCRGRQNDARWGAGKVKGRGPEPNARVDQTMTSGKSKFSVCKCRAEGRGSPAGAEARKENRDGKTGELHRRGGVK